MEVFDINSFGSNDVKKRFCDAFKSINIPDTTGIDSAYSVFTTKEKMTFAKYRIRFADRNRDSICFLEGFSLPKDTVLFISGTLSNFSDITLPVFLAKIMGKSKCFLLTLDSMIKDGIAKKFKDVEITDVSDHNNLVEDPNAISLEKRSY